VKYWVSPVLLGLDKSDNYPIKRGPVTDSLKARLRKSPTLNLQASSSFVIAERSLAMALLSFYQPPPVYFGTSEGFGSSGFHLRRQTVKAPPDGPRIIESSGTQ
jgi:hypothetical protein